MDCVWGMGRWVGGRMCPWRFGGGLWKAAAEKSLAGGRGLFGTAYVICRCVFYFWSAGDGRMPGAFCFGPLLPSSLAWRGLPGYSSLRESTTILPPTYVLPTDLRSAADRCTTFVACPPIHTLLHAYTRSRIHGRGHPFILHACMHLNAVHA